MATNTHTDGEIEEITEAADGCGGCAELWETMSQYRSEAQSAGGALTQDRRQFIQRVGVALGAIPLGAAAANTAAADCHESELAVDNGARTTGDLWGREGPGLDYDRKANFVEGSVSRILGGPEVCDDDIPWYKLRYTQEDDLDVWSSGHYLEQVEFWLHQDVITTTDVVGREEPGSGSTVVREYPEGTEGEIVENPTTEDGTTWWKVDYPDYNEEAWCDEEDLQYDENPYDVDELTGSAADDIIATAEASEEYQFVKDALPSECEDETKAFEYTVYDDDDDVIETGTGVYFGEYVDEEECTTIKWYETDDGDVKCNGSAPYDGGVRQAEGHTEEITETGTSEASDHAELVQDHIDSTDYEIQGEICPSSATVTWVDGENDYTVIAAGVDDDVVVDRVAAEVNGTNVSEVLSESNGDSLNSHELCFAGVCTDYCTILCGALSAVGAAVCGAKCSATVVGIPISPACGTICASAIVGVCYPTCVHHAH